MLTCEVAECGVSLDRLDIKCRSMAVDNSCLDVRVCVHFWKAAQTALAPLSAAGKEEEEEGDSLTKDIVGQNIQEQLLDFEVSLTCFTLLIVLIVFTLLTIQAALHCLRVAGMPILYIVRKG